ncbi:hypothetical protein NUKP104_47070 [Klebsiella variicola]|nr:hypothetical protein NUKP104_47070 [Klebsiella variicola]
MIKLFNAKEIAMRYRSAFNKHNAILRIANAIATVTRILTNKSFLRLASKW